MAQGQGGNGKIDVGPPPFSPPEQRALEWQLGSRVAKLESDVSYIQRDVSEIKNDIRAMKDAMERDFRLLFGALIAATLGLAAVMAKGFHWF